MNIEDLMMMKHEVLVTAVLFLVLIAGSYRKAFTGRSLSITFTGLFMLITIIGFSPLNDHILYGGMYLASPLPLTLKNILNSLTVIILLLSISTFGRHEDPGKARNFLALVFSSLLGMYLMLSAGHFIIFYIGLEMAAMPVAAAAAISRAGKGSPEEAIRMFLISGLASALILFGLSITYGVCGTLYYSELILVNKNNTLQVLAFFFIFAGFLVKIAVVPFNLWSARYSQNESSVSTSSLPVISAVSSIFIFLVILYSIFNTIPLVWQKSVFIVSVVMISAGNIVALLQKDINRFIAWSSSVQVFYIIAGIIARSQLAMTSVIFYTVCFAVSTLALIGVVGTVTESTGRSPVSSFRGLYRSNPGLGLAMTLALLSLAGIPPLAGFFGRFMVFTASAEKGFFFLLLIISANTLVSFYYYLRLVRTIFQDESGYSVPVIRNGFPFRLALTICIALIILAGFSGSLFDMLRDMSFGV